ncbi:MAG: ABC transporter ATP-binding protein [Lachnospiraceae bacterium]|nr:ABC transporter ATP-binding protein [Lachnospiraceae bacterium]
MEQESSNIAIHLAALSVGYGRTTLIRDIELKVRRGEILTLIGPNGAGKSTILKSIAGQIEPLGGVVYLKGQDKRKLTRQQVAQTLSMVMTGQPVTELMSCREVVATGRYPYTGRLGILSQQDWRKVDESLELVRAEEVAGKDFMELSDGQRQRVMLARALCQEPEILILDEPTSFLDVRYKVELLSTIRDIVKKQRLAVFMSLHELDLAKKVSDQIACVKGDRIERVGEPEEIFRGDTIARLYNMEQGSFESLFGVPQLPKVEGEAKVFVIGGGGSAVDTYYRLQRQGIPFAAGILSANDLEYPIVKELAVEHFVSAAYQEPAEELLEAAKRRIEVCEEVVCTVELFGTYNAFNKVLLQYAERLGKLVERREAENG